MVRRRADQAHARDGVTSLGYVRRHLNNHITCPMNYFLNLPPVSHSAELQERAPYAFFLQNFSICWQFHRRSSAGAGFVHERVTYSILVVQEVRCGVVQSHSERIYLLTAFTLQSSARRIRTQLHTLEIIDQLQTDKNFLNVKKRF